jgi:phenylacetate-CoA ligase
LAERLAANGLATDDSLREGLATLPILSKDDVLALQQADPPFGGALSADCELTSAGCSSRPDRSTNPNSTEPTRGGGGRRCRQPGWGPTIWSSTASAITCPPLGRCSRRPPWPSGARVLPGGIGNQDLQARAVADLGVTAYTGLPSYLKAILDRYDELGLPRERWRLHRALVTAEPLPDSLRALLRERVPTVLMAYGTAETGLIAYETEPGGGLLAGPGVLVQVCDLDTGAPITEGEGQVVVTLLRPTTRWCGSGPVTCRPGGSAPDGSPRLVGVLGRSGAAVKVRGMFLHPRQAARCWPG